MTKWNAMTPREIVSYLDEYVVGQENAKKAVALALRNRWRRLQLDSKLQEEVTPKNILMIGSTGVGKTELARRMAKIMSLPFVKVEASKYTEVGFVGRDVESMVRDLLSASLHLVESEYRENCKEDIDEYVLNKITKSLLPPLPSQSPQDKKEEYRNNFEELKSKVRDGSMDDKEIEVSVAKRFELVDQGLPPEFSRIQEGLIKVLSKDQQGSKKTMTIRQAKILLQQEASYEVLDQDRIGAEALSRAQEEGIIFIDEIDKVAVASGDRRSDPSKEGVQRDLLPIVEGSVVNTKYGPIKTDKILFIAAGAFHLSKPSDLIPELQGRFPIRVELDSLSFQAMYDILTQPKNSLIKQYQALLQAEDVELVFEDLALKELARLAQEVNEKTEDIGARRLHTVIEKVLEDVSFDAQEYRGKRYVVTQELVLKKLQHLIEDSDLTRYIL